MIHEVTMPARAEIEKALDGGYLWLHMATGSWWRVRRNGATQRWKRSPGRFRIPIKAGMKNYGEVTESTFVGEAPDLDNWGSFKRFHYLICLDDPNILAKYASEFEYAVAQGSKK